MILSTSSTTSFSEPESGAHVSRIIQTTLSVAIILATLFTGFTPQFFSSSLGERIALLLTPQVVVVNPLAPTSQYIIRIGIVSGHWGYDSGAVCSNGTTEADVNLSIATLVRQKLSALGLQIDLLQEFDPRLDGYRAALLLSIHNDSCDFIDEQATGYKVAVSEYSKDQNLANRLAACLIDRFHRITYLPLHPGSITVDMTDYHAFRVVNTATTTAIIETGFLNKDYSILTQKPDLIADGIVAGILCYVNSESIEATPMP